MRLRKQAAKPQSKYTPPTRQSRKYANKSDIDACPDCGGTKIKRSKRCLDCHHKAKRAPIDKKVYVVEGIRCRKMPLWNGKYTIVDASDYKDSMRYLWHEAKRKGRTSYAESSAGLLHRVLFNVTDPNIEVDHINHNGLDNRRKNLRMCKHIQNTSSGQKRVTNTSGYIGVHWFAQTRAWSSHIVVNYKQMHLGYFSSAIDAARVRDAAARKYHGEYATLNFVTDDGANWPQRLHRKTGKKLGCPSDLPAL